MGIFRLERQEMASFDAILLLDQSVQSRTMNYLTLTIRAFAVGLTTVAAAVSLAAQDYDIAIVNGRVVDPKTGTDKVANVGIDGSRIARITEEAMSGEKVIDAKGQVVAPGFCAPVRTLR